MVVLQNTPTWDWGVKYSNATSHFFEIYSILCQKCEHRFNKFVKDDGAHVTKVHN
jgi:hypothetical protein